MNDDKDQATRIGQTDVVSGDPPVPQRPSESHAQHTPGEWRIVRTRGGNIIEIAAPCLEHPNCGKTVVFLTSSSDHADANAHLIAAAPELLAALKLYVAHFGDPLKVAHAAIAKAEGRA